MLVTTSVYKCPSSCTCIVVYIVSSASPCFSYTHLTEPSNTAATLKNIYRQLDTRKFIWKTAISFLPSSFGALMVCNISTSPPCFAKASELGKRPLPTSHEPHQHKRGYTMPRREPQHDDGITGPMEEHRIDSEYQWIILDEGHDDHDDYEHQHIHDDKFHSVESVRCLYMHFTSS